MAITSFLNFDIDPGQVNNSAGLNQPVHLAGLQAYASQAMFGFRWTTTTNANESLGVTGVATDKFANGANGLVFFARTSDNNPAIAWEVGSNPMTATTSWRYTTGFRFKMATGSTATPTWQQNVLTITGLNSVILHLTTSMVLFFAGTTTGITLTVGREYYFEVMVENTAVAGPNYTPVMTLWLDGALIGQRTAISYSAAQNCHWRFGAVSIAANSNISYRRWLLGDVYCTNQLGDAPYNRRLGPQRTKTIRPTAVVANTWTPSEGTDPLALITGTNARVDTRFLTSPADDGASSYQFAFPGSGPSNNNGMFIFARLKRDTDATRPTVTTMTLADGTVVGVGPSVPTATAFTDTLVATFVPSTAAQALSYRLNQLQTAVISIKAPLS